MPTSCRSESTRRSMLPPNPTGCEWAPSRATAPDLDLMVRRTGSRVGVIRRCCGHEDFAPGTRAVCRHGFLARRLAGFADRARGADCPDWLVDPVRAREHGVAGDRSWRRISGGRARCRVRVGCAAAGSPRAWRRARVGVDRCGGVVLGCGRCVLDLCAIESEQPAGAVVGGRGVSVVLSVVVRRDPVAGPPAGEWSATDAGRRRARRGARCGSTQCRGGVAAGPRERRRRQPRGRDQRRLPTLRHAAARPDRRRDGTWELEAEPDMGAAGCLGGGVLDR